VRTPCAVISAGPDGNAEFYFGAAALPNFKGPFKSANVSIFSTTVQESTSW
jgi:hypothetical protein